MSKDIAAVLRDAALYGPLEAETRLHSIFSWVDAKEDFAIDFVYEMRDPSTFLLEGMDNEERRMFLLFCSLAAEDEE